jgi:hypothetical protein
LIIEATIEQLRTYCPLLEGRVAGAAQFTLGLQKYNTNLVLPAGFVIPLDQSSEGFKSETGIWQFVTKIVGVVVEFDAKEDRRGQVPVMQYDEMQASLFHALLNWVPGHCITVNHQGYWFEGGHFLDLDRARLFYQWQFGLTTELDDTDGWQIPSVPLESIEVDIYKAPPWEMPPPDGRPPAAIVKIPTANPPPEGLPQHES